MTDASKSPLKGRHILVVEDDYLIADDLARSLEDLGVMVLGPAGSVADAMALVAAGGPIDVGILDINLGSEKAFPVADALRQRSVPFVFATGYDRWIIPGMYADVPRFEKPVDTRALARFLAT